MVDAIVHKKAEMRKYSTEWAEMDTFGFHNQKFKTYHLIPMGQLADGQLEL